jgi:hypothetical protein
MASHKMEQKAQTCENVGSAVDFVKKSPAIATLIGANGPAKET